MHTRRILCFSHDLQLLNTRLPVLATVYETVGVRSLSELEALPSHTAFQLILLCHTLSEEECHTTTAVARLRWPEAKVLALATSFHECSSELADAVIQTTRGPAALLQAIAQLVSQTSPAPIPA